MALDGIEKELEKKFRKTYIKKSQGEFFTPKVHFVRYADDFIITGVTQELLENEVKPFVSQFLQERGLELSSEKTKITHINQGFDFLGKNIRKYNGKLIIKPAKKSIQNLMKKVRVLVKANKATTAGELIAYLNPIIRGWVNAHQHVCSSKIFSKIDTAIFRTLWKWAVRRHRNKGKRWIKQKYFQPYGNRVWTFTGKARKSDGTMLTARLFYADSVKIRRHVLINKRANPFDVEWEYYFEKRLIEKMRFTLKGKNQIRYLWFEQKGICPICQQLITPETGWHNHHIQWKTLGGKDDSTNRILLHPNCHQKVHNLKLHVAKPRCYK